MKQIKFQVIDGQLFSMLDEPECANTNTGKRLLCDNHCQ